MAERMSWSKLLSSERYDPRATKFAPASSAYVTSFQEDAEHILYSSAFRRLQGKTQVHPFPVFDYLRTRLTHTIEVAYVGRTIAAAIARKIGNDGGVALDPQDFGDIVYAACLAHDVGNPPFGHAGEYAIQTWFARKSGQDELVKDLMADGDLKNDFSFFDGNAQGFRDLTRLMPFREEGGMRLTYAVLGAYSKYPYGSKFASRDKPKFGYLDQDRPAASTVYGALGLLKAPNGALCRHPLAYIVEAADDICYLTTDIEDAHRAKILLFPAAEALLKRIADSGSRSSDYSQFRDKDEQDRLGYLRSAAIWSLMDEAILRFCDHLDDIMTGQFDQSLLENCKFSDQVKQISKVSADQIYLDRRKLETEQAGYQVITSLMEMYGGMILELLREKKPEKLNRINQGLHALLPDEFRRRLNANNPYASLLVLVDYIAGMTDRYALSLFQKLSGQGQM